MTVACFLTLILTLAAVNFDLWHRPTNVLDWVNVYHSAGYLAIIRNLPYEHTDTRIQQTDRTTRATKLVSKYL